MRKLDFFALSLLVGGCAVMQPLSGKATLVLSPRILPGAHTQSQILPYSQDAIDQLVLKLYTVNGAEQDTGLQRTLLNAQLDNPVVFSNLKAQTTYRVKAYAYANSQLISVDASPSYTDIVVTDNDRPTLGTLQVQLIDRAFNGMASSSVVFNAGKYSPVGVEGLQAPNLGIVTTYAGNGTAATINGYGPGAAFNFPAGVAVDAQGNVYIGEQNAHLIRKITPDRLVSILAGNGSAGLSDGTGASARFHTPNGLVPDAAGNVYVADRGSHRIRKVTAAGVVTTLAGNGTAGFAEGQGSAAQFSSPVGIALDSDGNLYVGDYGNYRIRKITSSGLVSTLAGNGTAAYVDGTGAAARFKGPHGVAVDAQGNVYVADLHNHCIRKITPAGVVSTLAGNGATGFAEGTGTSAILSAPWGVAVDAVGYVYAAEMSGQRIRKIAPNGGTLAIAGCGTAGFMNGTGTAAAFNNPHGIAVDSMGNIYVGEPNNARVRLIQ